MHAQQTTGGRAGGRGWLLVVWLVLALLATGSVGPFERACLHLGLAVLLARAWVAGPSSGVEVALRLGAPLGAALALGLLALPAAVLAQVAPGIVAARPLASWWTLSLRPEQTVGALASWLLLVSVLGLALDALRGADRRWVERGLAIGTVGWAVFGAAHALVGAERLLGLFEVRPGLGRFYAPLVNPNHHGVVLLMGTPFVVREAVEAWRAGRPEWVGWAAVVGWVVCFPWLVASMGLVFVLAVLGAVGVLWVVPPRQRAGWAVLGAVGLAAAAWGVQARQVEWWAMSGAPRLAQWSDGWRMLTDHPLAGVGGGAYEAAYAPYRTVPQFARFAHAHSDLQEWVVETGLVGLLLGLVALVRLRRLGAAGLLWSSSLLALATHGLVDFPWHVPAVAALGMAVLAGGIGPVEGARPDRRMVLLGLLVAQLVCVGWWGHLARVQRLVEGPRDVEATAWLARWAPWRPESALDALVLEREQGTLTPARLTEVAAQHPDEANLLRVLGQDALRLGALDLAGTLLERATLRDPNDFRTWAVRAELAAAREDYFTAAQHAAEGFRRWPRDHLKEGEPLERAYLWLPVGPWWLEALRDAPAHWSVRLAWMMLEEGDHETALAACEQAGRQREVAHGRMAACAEALVGLGRAAEARDYVEAWIAEEPEQAWAWTTKAALDQAEGALPAFRESAARALALRPEHPKVRRLAAEAAATCEGCGTSAPCAERCEGGVVVDLWMAWRASDDRTCEAALGRAFAGLDGPLWRGRMRWGCAGRVQQ